VAVSIPQALLTGLLIVLALRKWERDLPPLASPPEPRPLLRLGRWGGPIWLAVVAGAVAGVRRGPLGGLLWELGPGGDDSWSADFAVGHLRHALRTGSGLIAKSVSSSAATGLIAAALALVGSWLAAESRGLRVFLAVLLAAAWATPGPVV